MPPPSELPGRQSPVPPPPPGSYQVPAAPARGPRPRGVEISFWLWIVNLTLGVIGSLSALTQIDRLRAEAINSAVAQNPTLDRSLIESVATGVLIGTVLVGLLFIAIGFVFVFLMRGGRNWARIVLAVLGGLTVLLVLFGLTNATGPVLVTYVQLLLLVGAIATMFGPAANAWFRPRNPGF
ncbi:MAG: hypothetical protein M3460_11355 [Actinomycetota bacterium]|nr:hypothetical protein [Actinomycetota bacterium]